MKVFWRETPLTTDEADLLRLCLEAHAASAMRDNVSSDVLVRAALGGGCFTAALSSALGTLGYKHAPIESTIAVLHAPDEALHACLDNGGKLPGWGNSFHKSAPDPLWTALAEKLVSVAPSLTARIDAITALLTARGRTLFPNPSAYTAAVAITLGLPAKLASWLFVAGRLNTWASLFGAAMKGVS